MTPSTKHCSIFDLGLLTPKIYSPKFCTKSLISRLLWQIDRRCLGLLGGFRGWPIQQNHAQCGGADPCCHGNDIWARRGNADAYRLVIFFPDSVSFLMQCSGKCNDCFCAAMLPNCHVANDEVFFILNICTKSVYKV